MVTQGAMPESWNQFKIAATSELLPVNHAKRSRDRLRNLKQASSVSKYLSKLRKLTVATPDMHEEKNTDGIVKRLQ